MIYLWEIIWVWNENKCHNPVCKKSDGFPIFSKTYSQIATIVFVWLYQFCFQAMSYAVTINILPPYAQKPPIVGNLIQSFITRHRSPLFIRQRFS